MRPTTFPYALLMALIEIWLASAQASVAAPLATTQFKLDSLVGTWFEIAHIPNAIEHGHVASKNTYERLKNGRLRVCYSYREGFHQDEQMTCAPIHFHANGDHRDWHVWIFHIFPIHQRIMEIAPDNSWLLITMPGHDLAWIMARSAKMDRAQYHSLVIKLRDEYGIYTDKLQRIAQVPEQENQLGFEAAKIP